jgi:hypothetical protein
MEVRTSPFMIGVYSIRLKCTELCNVLQRKANETANVFCCELYICFSEEARTCAFKNAIF